MPSNGTGDQDQTPSPAKSGTTAPEREYEDYATADTVTDAATDEPDVLLDVPVLKIDELNLEVEDLRAHVSLRTKLANLVQIEVGVDAQLDKVKLNIKGADIQALLKVRLDRILETFDRALESIDNNPEILGDPDEPPGDLLSQQSTAVDAGEADKSGNGRTELRAVEGLDAPVETTLNESGEVVEERIVKGS